MRTTKRAFMATALLAALFVVAPPHVAHAKKDKSEQKATKKKQGREQGKSVAISREQAAAIASSKTGGRVLSVDLRGNAYRVKVLVDGKRVRTVGVDARSGRLSN